MKTLADALDDFLAEDTRLPLLLKAIRREPDFLSFQLTDSLNRLVTDNNHLKELYKKHKKLLANAVVMQEYIKEIACMIRLRSW